MMARRCQGLQHVTTTAVDVAIGAGAAEAHGQAGGPHVSQPAVALQLIETFMQILMAQPEVRALLCPSCLGLMQPLTPQAMKDLPRSC